MNTREKILDQARRLFNDRGLTTITMRHIAEALGISLGNLTYHFQKREDLVMAIYQELVTKMNGVMEELMHEKSAFVQIHRGALRSMEMFYEYRFFLIDLVFIMRNYPEIQRHYMQLQVQREIQFLALFTQLQKAGWMRRAQIPMEYEHLYRRMQILGDYWISSAVSLELDQTPDFIRRYHRIMMELIYPYLTEQGREAFEKLNTESV